MTRRSEALHFVVPGRLDQATGGYRYDAAMVAALRAQGRDVVVHELPGRFPEVDAVARAGARHALQRINGAPVVIDGLALPAFDGALKRRAPVVGLVHHPLWLETGLTVEAASRLRALEAGLLVTLDKIVVTSHATAADVAALGVQRKRIAVVEPGTPRAAPRRRRGGAPRILCVAALTPRKAHDVLLRALSIRRRQRWSLLCVGGARDVHYARGLKAAVRGARLGRRVRFAGEVPWPRLVQHYGRADVFALPSRHEGYGMAFAEALAHGLPVIGARAGAVPDVVPAQAGVLAPPGDVQALARILGRLIRSPTRRARLARGAYLSRRRFPEWPQQARAFSAALAR